VLVSPPEMHDFLRTVIVAPMTIGSRPAGFRIPVTFQGKSGLILLDQIRTLDKSRLVKRVGAVHPTTLEKVLRTLQAVFEPA
jgi:mRNA interferase MazF